MPSKIIFAAIIATAVVSSGKDTAVLLAQSCVGEAGFKSWETGECAAIAHIYRKRSMLSGAPLRNMVRSYSSAVKPGNGKPWILQLDRKGTRPEYFRGDWGKYKDDWKSTLGLMDAFLRGDIPDPLPEALHYGGKMDTGLNLRYWQPLASSFRNIFYKRRGQQHK